jgi:hypothetical protein
VIINRIFGGTYQRRELSQRKKGKTALDREIVI